MQVFMTRKYNRSTRKKKGAECAMKKIYVGKEFLDVLENTLELKYYILETEYKVDNMNIKEYGIEIEKYSYSKIERIQVPNVTTDQTRIDFIVKILMKNSVTPVHLHDVIGDML